MTDHNPNISKPGQAGSISDLLFLGARMIGTFESGATIAKGEDYHSAFTSSIDEIINLYMGKGDSAGRAKGTPIRRFKYYPGEAGFIVLDLDRKNGKDGVKDLITLLQEAGLLVPDILADLDGGSFPCAVKTPSGGFHLYFRYMGSTQYPHTVLNLSGSVELFHFKATLTAPGSQKDGKPYELQGRLKNAPAWPPILDRFIQSILAKREQESKAKKEAQALSIRTRPSLAQIGQGAMKYHKTGSAYSLAIEIAKRAFQKKYTDGEILAFLKTFTETAGTKGLDSALAEGKAKGPPSLGTIAKWAEMDCKLAGRNGLAAEIALRAARPEYGYLPQDVENFLETYPGTINHDQIKDAVKSAYKTQGRTY